MLPTCCISSGNASWAATLCCFQSAADAKPDGVEDTCKTSSESIVFHWLAGGGGGWGKWFGVSAGGVEGLEEQLQEKLKGNGGPRGGLSVG